MRESAEAKGRRYLIEGRLIIRSIDSETIRATCRGSGEEYEVGFDPGGWWCSCPALGRCCHLLALQLVTLVPTRARLRQVE